MGIYTILVTVKPQYYDQLASTISGFFSLNVRCVPKKIFVSEKFSLGKMSKDIFTDIPIPQDIRYKPFILEPKCTGPGTDIEYSLTDIKGVKVPSYITLNEDDRTISIAESDSLNTG